MAMTTIDRLARLARDLATGTVDDRLAVRETAEGIEVYASGYPLRESFTLEQDAESFIRAHYEALRNV